VGAVFDALRRRGTLDNTLFVYMGDNGFLLGEHGLVDKRVMYEPSIRVPLLVHWPDAAAGGRTADGMALNIDIAPTFLDAAGVAIPPGVHGRSLVPMLEGEAAGWRTEFLYEYFWDYEALHTPGVMGLRTDRHVLMEYQGIWDVNELYDLREDPEQRNNLLAGSETATEAGGWLQRIRSREVRALAADLHARMVKILEATGGRERLNGPPVG
jgi:N-acetylglucosamine-6-sulfatase